MRSFMAFCAGWKEGRAHSIPMEMTCLYLYPPQTKHGSQDYDSNGGLEIPRASSNGSLV